MASKHNTKKSTKTPKKKKNAVKQNNIRETGMVQDEIILVVTLVVSILLFLSNFDLSGKVGKFFSDITFGLIGVLSYILPFAVFFITAFHISNLGNKKAGRKILSAIVFLVALAAFIQMVTGYNPEMKIYEYFTVSRDFRKGGGIIGGILVMIFCGLFDTVATYVILIAMMIISLTVITGKALLTHIAKKGNAVYHERKEYQRLAREEQLAYEAEHPQEIPLRRPPKTFVLNTGKKSKAGKMRSQKRLRLLI